MNRKFKLALAALLGFSAACSSVRNVPVKGADKPQTDSLQGNDTANQYRIIVMYGVRPPRIAPTVPADSVAPQPTAAPERYTDIEVAPVAEKPSDE